MFSRDPSLARYLDLFQGEDDASGSARKVMVYFEHPFAQQIAATTFVVELPPRRPGSRRATAPSDDQSEAVDEPPTLLVVDDDLDVREALVEMLEDRGFVVLSAENGADALEQLRSMSASPDAILLDLMMPVLDGYGFLDVQRQDPQLASIPVVVITAGHGVDRTRIGESTPVIRKPIRIPLLMSTLQNFEIADPRAT